MSEDAMDHRTVSVQSDTMKDIETIAYVLEEPKADFKLTEVILDEVRADELLVEMKYSGICHTDLVTRAGNFSPPFSFPGILGHEGAGRILSLGSAIPSTHPHLNVGDLVILSFNTCGNCKQCRRGHPSRCLNGGKLHFGGRRPSDDSTPAKLRHGKEVTSQFYGMSSFSRHSVVQVSSVAMRFTGPVEESAKFVGCGCGFQTGAGTVLNVLKPQSDDVVVVFGLGGVGLSALMAAKFLGVERIIGVDIAEERFALAKEVGATVCINSKEVEDVVVELQKVTEGAGVDFAIDCVGNTVVIEQMVRSLARCGTAVGLGVPPSGKKVELNPGAIMANRRYIGCLQGDSVPSKFIPQAVEMQRSGKFPLEKLIGVYPYQDMSRALADMHAGKVIKPVLEWS